MAQKHIFSIHYKIAQMADIFAFKMMGEGGGGRHKYIKKEKLWVFQGFFQLIIELGVLTHIYEILFADIF